MNYTKHTFFVLFLLSIFSTFSQQTLTGTIQINENNKNIGLDGVNVFWENTKIGSVTNFDGEFTIPYKKEYKKLVITYIGYQTDILTIDSNKPITHVLKPGENIEEITIKTRKKTTSVSSFEVANVQKINSTELLKAACCNLSESFETNASVDVNFSDAVTGAKQIKMLGLASPYILFTDSNIPSIRGASRAFGLTYMPGTWINSIQIIKGAGSVVNGYESISGQINTEIKNPVKEDKLFVNAYASDGGRFELNTHLSQKLNDKWHAGLFVHGNTRTLKTDDNEDNFLDMPLGNQINLLTSFKYKNNESGWRSTINVQYLTDEKQSGEMDFDKDIHTGTTLKYGTNIDVDRFVTTVKLGKVFADMPYKSVGFQSSYSLHDQKSYYGINDYNINQSSFYFNSIYQSIINNTNHKFKTGVTVQYDKFDEEVLNNQMDREERSAGAYFEYTFNHRDKLNIVAGLRADYSNVLDFFITPRLHAKYKATDNLTFRSSVGFGKRNPLIFTENQKLFASSRQVIIPDITKENYGLDPEEAWNYGFSAIQKYTLFGKKGDIGADYYVTDFKNQVIVDYENPREVSFYNLDRKSIAKSLQISVNQEIAKGLDLRLAYKYTDVKMQYNDGVKEKPYVAKERFFINTTYKRVNKERKDKFWMFDTTLNYIGKQRIPSTAVNPLAYQRITQSDPHIMVNAQISNTFNKNFNVYLGAENIFNHKQDNPIIAADDPFGAYFDSTMVYKSIAGSNFYVGLRYSLN